MDQFRCFLGLITILFLVFCNSTKESASSLVYERLSDESNWNLDGEAQWSFAGDIITGSATGSTGFIISKESYSHFILELEFYPDSTINSGIFIRCPELSISPIACHEMNIWDLHPNQENRTGAIVAKAKPKTVVHTLNKWNTYRIKCEDHKTEVWVNDMLTAEFKDTTILNGLIALQAAETGTVKFRNIKIAKLDP